MDQLDLDINNYTFKDIEKFFQLKSNSKYTASDIELKEYKIREQLLNSGHINKRFKRELIEFLTTAKKWLLMVKCKPNEERPTTIPKNYQLDPLDTPLLKDPPSRLDELIKREDTQFIYANPSEYFPGVINPLNTRIINKCLNIDTRFRDNLYNTQSSDFTLQLPTKFNKVVSMKLSSIELPVAFYGISSSYGNNYLYIKLNYTLNTDHDYLHYNDPSFCDLSKEFPPYVIAETEKIFIIPDGNYTSTDLIDAINYVLSPKDVYTSEKDPFNVFSYIKLNLDVNDNGSGSRKVSIGPLFNNHVVINSIEFDFTKNIEGLHDTTNISRKLGWNLGFTKPKYSGDCFHVAETMIEPTTKYIYLAIDDFNNNSNNHFITAFNQSILNTDIIARISLKGPTNNASFENSFTLVSEPRKYFGPVDIQRLRVRLFDEYGRILAMNHSNYSFCLTLQLLYDL